MVTKWQHKGTPRMCECVCVLQVVFKIFAGASSAAMCNALEQQTQLLRSCQYVCQVIGVSAVEQKACVIFERHHSLAAELSRCAGEDYMLRHAVSF